MSRVNDTEMLRLQSQPSPEDVTRYLDAARVTATDQYRDPGYLYVREALSKVFDNCIRWLEEGIEPGVVLLEALHDERAILDRHNRMQVKAYHRQENHCIIPEEIVYFPFRAECLNDGRVMLPSGLFETIYQTDDFNSPTPHPSERYNYPKRYSAGKLADAPSTTHDFPAGNITLAEIAAFLPQSIKSWDVADRIIWNGAASEDLAMMFNKYRDLSHKIDINSVYLMFRGQMRKRTEAEYGYKTWKKWVVSAQAAVPKPRDFDPDSVSVAGFRRPIIFQNRPDVAANPILFKDLAKGVAIWPQGYDALDLTRCVRWCADHPGAEFYYPIDYQTVLQECVGGPLDPDPRHSDAHALARLRSVTGRTAPRRRMYRYHELGDVHSDEGGSARSGECQRSKRAAVHHGRLHKSTTASVQQVLANHSITARLPIKRSAELEMNPDMDSDDDAYRGPKRMKQDRAGPRRSERNNARSVTYFNDDGANLDENADGSEQTQ